MVAEFNQAKPSPTSSTADDEDYQLDSISVSSYQENKENGLVLRQNDQNDISSYGNVSIRNSNDVHFGNKTFYQGPVTIKQFLYPNSATSELSDSFSEVFECAIKKDVTSSGNGVDNPAFSVDHVISNKETKDNINKGLNVDLEEKHSVIHGVVKNPEGLRWTHNLSHNQIAIALSILALLVISLIAFVTVILLRHNSAVVTTSVHNKYDTDEQDHNTPIKAPLDPSVDLSISLKLKIVTRLEWLAQPPIQTATHLETPVPYAIIMHTATENCSSQAQCIFLVRHIQTFHIESKNWWDIGYNFLVGGDGEVYEGRGWESEGAHTFSYNARSIGIAFIGTFLTTKPPDRQIIACKRLIQRGVELGYLRNNYTVLAARQLFTTQSPGAALYEDIKTWPHWGAPES